MTLGPDGALRVCDSRAELRLSRSQWLRGTESPGRRGPVWGLVEKQGCQPGVWSGLGDPGLSCGEAGVGLRTSICPHDRLSAS